MLAGLPSRRAEAQPQTKPGTEAKRTSPGDHPVVPLSFDPKKLRMAGFAELWRIIREDTPPRPSTRLSALGESTREIAVRRRTSPQFLRRRLRGDLDWITMKSLAKTPDERYASASEFAADLHRHLDSRPVLAGPPSLGYRLRKFAVRRRRAGPR